MPALRIAALRFTDSARARITQAGGECLTFDQLALLQPKGTDTVLLRARKTARQANKHFGAPGVPGSTVQPKVRAEGRKVRLLFVAGFRYLVRACTLNIACILCLPLLIIIICSSRWVVDAVTAVALRCKLFSFCRLALKGIADFFSVL